MISGIGGLLGVALGIGGAQVITPLLGGTEALVTGQSVGLALAVSLAIGVFFGLYPANRAAEPEPDRGATLRMMAPQSQPAQTITARGQP